MAEPFVAEIRIMPYTYAPRGWAWCNGSSLPVSQFSALFSLITTIYGGDGRTNFALPDLQGRVPMQPRQSPGLSNHVLGQWGGSDFVTLDLTQIPSHQHTLYGQQDFGSSQIPDHSTFPEMVMHATDRMGSFAYHNPDGAMQMQNMHPSSMARAGGDQPHENRQPVMYLHFCIALDGVYPPRN
jgi:microcystin-dependent protein